MTIKYMPIIPIAIYKMDDSINTTLIDYYGNNNLTVTNSSNITIQQTSLVPYNINYNEKSILFNGGYGIVSLNTVLSSSTGILNSFFIKTSSSSGSIINKNTTFLIELNSGKIKVSGYYDSGTYICSSINTINDNNSHFIIVTLNNSLINIYIDGVYSNSINIPSGSSIIDSSRTLTIGNMIGTLDDVFIFEGNLASIFYALWNSIATTIPFSSPSRQLLSFTKVLIEDYSLVALCKGIGKIWGTVKNANQNPLQKRIVLLEYFSYVGIAETVSDSNGYYEFDGLNTSIVFTIIAEDSRNYRYNSIIRACVQAT